MHKTTGERKLSSSRENDWHILGAGAMGCLWAARIAQWLQHQPAEATGLVPAGLVTLLVRNQADADTLLQRGGITLEQAGRQTLVSLQGHAMSTAGPDTSAPAENLLVATKAQQVLAALSSGDPILTPHTRIVLLQNGLKVQNEVAAAYGAHRVFCLSTSHGAYLKGPFHVVHAGQGEAWLGQPGLSSESSRELLARLPSANMNLRVDPDIERRLWLKFAVNCAVNVLTVLHDCRNGELLSIASAHQDLRRLCREIETVLAALPEAPTVTDLEWHVDGVLTATAMNFSSTLQDVRNGRSTEVAHLNGYLRELAQAQGISCPVNDEFMSRFRALTDERD